MNLVLAGDDGSDAAGRAVAWAESFAAERGLVTLVIHVGDEGGHDGAQPGSTRITVSDRYPAVAIMEVATDRGASVIVLGRRGAGGFPSLPIGTTAHVVAGSSGLPVVVVPPFHQPKRPLVGRVVVGVDRLPGSRAALEWSSRVFPEAKFEAVHALDLGPAFAHMEIEDPNVYEQAHAAAVGRMQQQWCEPLTAAGVRFDTHVVEGAPAEVLIETATRTGADLVVVGRRSHGALQGTLGGVSQRILAYSPCPSVVMPSGG